MLNTYRNIEIQNLSEHCGLASPIQSHDCLNLNSDAKKLMVDFYKYPATTANESITVNDALTLMRANRIRALMIVNQKGGFAGIITAMDLMGRKPMLYANEADIPLTYVQVKNVMLPKTKLGAITRYDVNRALIGDIIQTFRKLGEQHLLVVDGYDSNMKICGLFSVTDFKKALNMPFETTVFTNTFADLERVIHERKEIG